jgi:S1-C subfamily serine protease
MRPRLALVSALGLALAGTATGCGRHTDIRATSVPVQPGNSGGPLVDHGGRALGVVVGRAAEVPFLKYTGTLPQNVNPAIKAELVRVLLDGRALPAQRDTATREQAVDRTRGAICLVLAAR